MAINGLPLGLAKKAEGGNLPPNNPHVKAYMAQQAADKQAQESAAKTADLQKQLDALTAENTKLKEAATKPAAMTPGDVVKALLSAIVDNVVANDPTVTKPASTTPTATATKQPEVLTRLNAVA